MTFEEIIAKKVKSHAYLAGVDDFNTNQPCKYPDDCKYFQEWQEGFLDAQLLQRIIHDQL